MDADASVFEANGVEVICIFFPDNHGHLLVGISAVEIKKEMAVSMVIDSCDFPTNFGIFAYVIFRFGRAVCPKSYHERHKKESKFFHAAPLFASLRYNYGNEISATRK